MSQAYEVTVEDVENVLASNPLEIPLAPGETLEARAAELFGDLDFGMAEEAALCGDDLDEQTDYANDEIARQLRERGILSPLPSPEASRPTSQ